MTDRDLGLFPLQLVLLPGERVPLHIFEARYRALVADCVLGDTPFVMALAHEDGVATIGCTARVDRLIRRHADGRMEIFILGLERVEILDETDGRMYFSALVRDVADEVPSPATPALADEVLARFRELAEQVAGAPTLPNAPEGTPISYAVAGAVELPVEAKQELLEMLDETARLEEVLELLSDAQAAVDREKIAAERAQRNGKVIAP